MFINDIGGGDRSFISITSCIILVFDGLFP